MKESHKMELTMVFLLKINSNDLINKKMSNKYLFSLQFIVNYSINFEKVKKVNLKLNFENK